MPSACSTLYIQNVCSIKMSDIEDNTALEIEQDDDNIQRIHERSTLLNDAKKKVKTPSCRTMLGKVCLISFAGVLFILMMVEMWADYGQVIKTQTLFPPRIYSISETCPNATMDDPQLTKEYNALSCEWTLDTNGTKIDCEGNLPPNPLVLPSIDSGSNNIHIEGDHLCVTWLGRNISRCVRLIVWSI